MNITRDAITAGVLAGGAGRRLGGVDKGWYGLGGQPLVEHTLDRVRPQAGAIVISANRQIERYRALGHPVVPDRHTGYPGPLAGLLSVLQVAATPFVLAVPVDTPALPHDLVARLAAAFDVDIDLVAAAGAGRLQPLHALMRASLATDLEAALADGLARVTDWYARLRTRVVDWPDARAFANINTLDDARAFADRLPGG